MKRSDYHPGPPTEVEAHTDGERWSLVFRRDFRHAPPSVWRVLTGPAELAEWAPFDVDRDLGHPGEVTLTMAGGGEPVPGHVQRAEAPALLEYTWGDDVLRWELEPIRAGTRLTLRHTVQDRDWLAKVAAGWHLCLDVADLLLAGQPIGRIAGPEALQFGWSRLHEQYAERLGMAR